MSDSSFQYKDANESPGFLLFKINCLWHEKLNIIFTEFSITQTQYAIMASILWFEERNKLISQADLVLHTKIEKMTLSKAIRNLETKKFITRKQSIKDSRALNISITSIGKKEIKKLIKKTEEADEIFFNVISFNELKIYKSTTLKLLELNQKCL
jgi:DNA-binding MarR family transcriptional regulator